MRTSLTALAGALTLGASGAPAQQTMQLQELGRTPSQGGPAQMERVDFGLMSFDVPQGWEASAQLGDMTGGAFFIRTWDPAGRHELRIFNNCFFFTDQQTDGYRAGHGIVEAVGLPGYAEEIAQHGYEMTGITWRGEISRRESVTDPVARSIGVSLPIDSGEMSFGVRTPQGENLTGVVYAETERTYEYTDPVSGQNWGGSYRVPMVALALAPQDQQSQALAQQALIHMFSSAQFSQEYLSAQRGVRQDSLQTANNIHQLNMETNQEIFDMQQQTYADGQASNDRGQAQFVDVIHEGTWATNPQTGAPVWTSLHNNQSWQNNQTGAVTGSQPNSGNWTQLQQPAHWQ